MSKAIHIDFVSDLACPWCAVGLGALHFKPFELNPEGQGIVAG